MKKNLIAIALMSVISSSFVGTAAAENKYLNAAEAKTFSAKNGAIVSAETWHDMTKPEAEHAQFSKAAHQEISPGVHTFNFGGIVNLHMIEAPEGLIVLDTGDNDHEGDLLFDAIRKVSDAPIKAIIYSHEHYTFGAGSLLAREKAFNGNQDIQIIGHHETNVSMAQNGGLGRSVHQETSGILMARALEQFGVLLPAEGADAKQHKFGIQIGMPMTFVPVNTPVDEGDTLNIAGLKTTFYTDNIGTDTDVQVLVKFEESGIVFNNLMWQAFPNIYSARGGNYRNPEQWVKALDQMLELEPKILLSTHTKSKNDPDLIRDDVEAYSDALQFVLNRTLMGMNLGYTEGELAYFVQLPEHLQKHYINSQDYGEISNMVPAIAAAVRGPYDRDAANLIPIRQSDEAKLMVKAFGEATIQEKAIAAYNDGDYLFSAKLGSHLVNYQASEKNKQIKANAIRKMGYLTESTNSRSHFLTQARELEGKHNKITNVPARPDMVSATTADHVNYMRIRVNPESSIGVNAKIGFEFSDGQIGQLHIRNGVGYFKNTLEGSDAIVKMDNTTFTAVFNNMASLSDLVAAGKASTTNLAKANEIMGHLDIVYDWENNPGLQDLSKVVGGLM